MSERPAQSADAPPWEVLVFWGERRLHAEVLSPRTRARLVLGAGKDADVPTGHPSRIVFALAGQGLALEFSPGVTGTLQQRGDWPVPLAQLVEKGVVKDAGGRFEAQLHPGDALELSAGALTVKARQVKARAGRLPVEATALAIFLLALIAVVLVLLSVLAPDPSLRLHWIHGR